MRCAIAHPCIGSRAIVRRINRSRVPCRTSVWSLICLSCRLAKGDYGRGATKVHADKEVMHVSIRVSVLLLLLLFAADSSAQPVMATGRETLRGLPGVEVLVDVP